MRIVCCIKVVVDFDLPSNHRWEIENNQIDFSFYRKVINCYDAACLELALQAKGATQGVSVAALTVSADDAVRFIKPLYAVGVDRCVQLASDSDLRFEPTFVAELLTDWVQKNPQEYILLGARQSVGQNGAVGPMLAERLGWPLYSGVTAFVPQPDGSMRVELRIDGATLVLAVPLRAVLVLDDSVTMLLHTPTIKEKLAASGREVERQQIDRQPASLTALQSLEETKTDKVCTMLTLEEATEWVLHRCKGGQEA